MNNINVFSYVIADYKISNLKVEMYFQNKKDRGIVNEFWEDLYQNESNRPSRHSHEASLPTGCIFQMTFVALKSS